MPNYPQTQWLLFPFGLTTLTATQLVESAALPVQMRGFAMYASAADVANLVAQNVDGAATPNNGSD
jgi:hypothetical protein